MKLLKVIDNISIVKYCLPPKQAIKANGKPFEFCGVIYSPKYLNGQIQRYEAALKNLRLFMYPDKIYLINSLHKFWHGCNYNDFYSNELKAAIETISETTGINWQQSTIKKIEYGCNVSVNANNIINSLKSYKGKDFQAMVKTGTKYGASCGFEQYRLKGYDKGFEVMKLDKVTLSKPLFRWEIQVTNAKYFDRFKQPLPITIKELLRPDFLNALAKDAITIYQNSLKMQKLQLSKLTTHEKRVLAAMLNPEIREDLKNHNKETYKRDRRIYKRLMLDKSICINDETGELIEEKFKQLIEGIKLEENYKVKKQLPTCSIVGNRGNILTF